MCVDMLPVLPLRRVLPTDNARTTTDNRQAVVRPCPRPARLPARLTAFRSCGVPASLGRTTRTLLSTDTPAPAPAPRPRWGHAGRRRQKVRPGAFVNRRDIGFCRKVRFLGQNPKIGCQEFNDLETPKLSKKQRCDRTRKVPWLGVQSLR